jgi:hypothetical protein
MTLLDDLHAEIDRGAAPDPSTFSERELFALLREQYRLTSFHAKVMVAHLEQQRPRLPES